MLKNGLKRFLKAMAFVVFIQVSLIQPSFGDIASSESEWGLSLVGGKEDLSESFPSVLAFSLEDKELDSRCTGTKVGNNFVLTAAHCFIEESPKKTYPVSGLDHSPFYFSFSARVPQVEKVNEGTVKRVLFPPELANCFERNSSQVKECIDKAPDIAVVELDESAEFSLAPISEFDTSLVNSGDFITFVGFGLTSDKDKARPVRKFHVSKVSSPEELKQAFDLYGITEAEVNFNLYFGTLGVLVGKNYANLGSGDSGGPVFRSRDGRPFLVGVNAFTFCPDHKEDCEATSNSFFNRINVGGPYHLGEWLSSVLK